MQLNGKLTNIVIKHLNAQTNSEHEKSKTTRIIENILGKGQGAPEDLFKASAHVRHENGGLRSIMSPSHNKLHARSCNF